MSAEDSLHTPRWIDEAWLLAHSFWTDSARASDQLENALTLEALAGPAKPAYETLLRIAQAEGVRAWAERADHPFFRLTVRERFLLIAFHRFENSSLPYSEVARVLDLKVSEVESVLWRARLDFSASVGDFAWPRAQKVLGVACPEYEVDRPWTQRFMDDELQMRERIFLQTHLMACEPCRKKLESTRELLFRIEGVLRDWVRVPEGERNQLAERWAPASLAPWQRGLVSVRQFVQGHRDAQWALWAGILLSGFWVASKL